MACGSDAADPGGASAGTVVGEGTVVGGAGDGTLGHGDRPASPPCAEEGCEALASGNWTSLPGYLGPLGPAASEVPAARVDVGSVHTAPEGGWSATGLVVNGPEARTEPITVTATLLAADGSTLDRVEGTSPVAPVHAGEPVPFRVASGVAADAVHEVAWDVGDAAGPVPTDEEVAQRRGLQISVFWTHPATSTDRPAIVGHELPEGPSHVVYGEVAAGEGAVESPAVAAAWLDDAGRLLAIAEAPAYLPGSATPVDRLEPGGAADLVLIVSGPAGPSLHEREPILWGYPR